jgi:FeS assembly SUF system protein
MSEGSQSVPEVSSPPPSPSPPAPAAEPKGTADREALIRKALKKIYDPEIPMNIVDLGLIYGLDFTPDDQVTVRMTMTGPGCPVAGILAEEVKTAVETVPGVKGAKVEVVWEPPWGPDKMSDFAKRQFGYL